MRTSSVRTRSHLIADANDVAVKLLAGISQNGKEASCPALTAAMSRSLISASTHRSAGSLMI
jgi:hypothetical protein